MIDTLLVAIDEALQSAQAALEADCPAAALPAVRSARAAVRAAVNGILGPEPLDQADGEPRGATLDPATCGHPETFPFPAVNLCRTCGATRLPDGTWEAPE